MQLVIIGATGTVGQYLVRLARVHGHQIVALERDFPPRWLDRDDMECHQVDILQDDFAAFLDGADAVISTVGLTASPQTLWMPPPLYTEGALRIMAAMRQAKVGRLIMISAAFADPTVRVPLWFRLAVMTPMDRIFSQIADMERVVMATRDIDWTLVRPGWLIDLPASHDYQVEADHLPPATLRARHADVAHFLLECAENGGWSRERPAVARPESIFYENPYALIGELPKFLTVPKGSPTVMSMLRI